MMRAFIECSLQSRFYMGFLIYSSSILYLPSADEEKKALKGWPVVSKAPAVLRVETEMYRRFWHGVHAFSILTSAPVYWSVVASLQPLRRTMEADISSCSNIGAVDAANPHKWNFSPYIKHSVNPWKVPIFFQKILIFPISFMCECCVVLRNVPGGFESQLCYVIIVCWSGCLSKLLFVHLWNGGNDSGWLLCFVQYQTQKVFSKQRLI